MLQHIKSIMDRGRHPHNLLGLGFSILSRQLLSLFSLDPHLPVQESYEARVITPSQVFKFIGGIKEAIYPKVPYGITFFVGP